MNLVSNAFKFTTAGSISVTVRVKPCWCPLEETSASSSKTHHGSATAPEDVVSSPMPSAIISSNSVVVSSKHMDKIVAIGARRPDGSKRWGFRKAVVACAATITKRLKCGRASVQRQQRHALFTTTTSQAATSACSSCALASSSSSSCDAAAAKSHHNRLCPHALLVRVRGKPLGGVLACCKGRREKTRGGNGQKRGDPAFLQILVEAPAHARALLEVDVRDSGVGMTPEQTARLFKPFSQVRSGWEMSVVGGGQRRGSRTSAKHKEKHSARACHMYVSNVPVRALRAKEFV